MKKKQRNDILKETNVSRRKETAKLMDLKLFKKTGSM